MHDEDDTLLASLQRKHLMASTMHWSLLKSAVTPPAEEYVEDYSHLGDEYADALDELPLLEHELPWAECGNEDGCDDFPFGGIDFDGNELIGTHRPVGVTRAPIFDDIQLDRDRVAEKRGGTNTPSSTGGTRADIKCSSSLGGTQADINQAHLSPHYRRIITPNVTLPTANDVDFREWCVPDTFKEACVYMESTMRKRWHPAAPPQGFLSIPRVSPEVKVPKGLKFIDLITIREWVMQQAISCHARDKQIEHPLPHYQMAVVEMAVHFQLTTKHHLGGHDADLRTQALLLTKASKCSLTVCP